MPVALFRALALNKLGELDEEGIVEDLKTVAAISLVQRAPWLGLLDAALTDPRPAVRAAGMSALGGATGYRTIVRLTEALRDPSNEVKAAAVNALRISSPGLPARWALVVFDRDPVVRQLAHAGATPTGCESLGPYLVPDPVRSRAAEVIGLVPIHLILDYRRLGTLDGPTARAWIEQSRVPSLLIELLALPARSTDEIATVLGGAAGHENADGLDRLIELWNEPAVDPAGARQLFLYRLADELRDSKHIEARARVSAALFSVLRRRGFLGDAPMGLLTILQPQVAFDRALPRSLRLAGIEGLIAQRDKLAARPELGDVAFASDLIRHEDGSLDLRVLAALAHVLDTGSKAIGERFGIEAIAVAFLAGPERSAPFLDLKLADGRLGVVGAIAEHAGAQRGLVFAMAMKETRESLEPFAQLEIADVVGAALEIDRLRRAGAADLKEREIAMTTALKNALGSPAGYELLLRTLLARPDRDELTFLISLWSELVLALSAGEWVARTLALREPELTKVLALLPSAPAVSAGKEAALAHALAVHESPAIRGWAKARAPAPLLEGPEALATAALLSAAECDRIARCPDADLPGALKPALRRPSRGWTHALASRAPRESVEVCVALLGCHDDPALVARLFQAFSRSSESFLAKLDSEVVRTWQGRQAELPLLGNAWLHLFEAHAAALIEGLEKQPPNGITGALDRARALDAPQLTHAIWSAVATEFERWRWRDRARLGRTPEALLDLAVGELDSDLGRPAARILAALAQTPELAPAVEARRPTIIEHLPEMTDAAREALATVVDSRGVASSPRAPRARTTSLEGEVIERIRSLTDVEELTTICAGAVLSFVHEAAVRLIARCGAPGEAAIVELLSRASPVPHAIALADAVALLSSAEAIDTAAHLVIESRGAGAVPELRFTIALSLALEHKRPRFVAHALEAARGGPAGWLRKTDVDRLERLIGRAQLARELAPAPHPHAYERAMAQLLEKGGRAPLENVNAVRAFLEAGRDRRADLRIRAAEWLLDYGDTTGAPLLIGQALSRNTSLSSALLREMTPAIARALVEGGLGAGPGHVNEARLIELTRRVRQTAAREEGLRRILSDATVETSRRTARDLLVTSTRARDAKLRAIASVFAWGVLRGRELTGRLLSFHIAEGGALGYTQLRGTAVNVTPLPIFRGDRHGREIVEGLVLHEIGHHIHHSSPEALAIWDAAKEQVRLLNLVMDEHLERNLRAIEPEWGDRLKTLGAWAFRHSRTDIPIATLLAMLGARTFEVLTAARLQPSRWQQCVHVHSGEILGELEARGHSFSRFVHALRLGQGDRWDDPKVRQGLALFGKSFKRSTPAQLWEITLELRRIFGNEVDLTLGLGGPESITDGELPGHDEGISDEDVQREVRRVLEPPGSQPGSGRRGPLAINVGGAESWTPITNIKPVMPNPAAHAGVAAKVRRQSDAMRRALDELGLRHVHERMRVTGRRLDPTRIRPLVIRGDPRLLIARRTEIRTDLFLGLVIDCSGSMVGQSMERAHAFGVLLAEAARGNPNIDFRAFGFTDRTIYDAGNATRCAITSLWAHDGNNDAAALDHVAQGALASRRRARLIVMISDGLPTECSVAALKAAVRSAGRRGIACAQVAVRPLEEICFPDYVLIEGDYDSAVARFGAVVTRLIRRVIR